MLGGFKRLRRLRSPKFVKFDEVPCVKNDVIEKSLKLRICCESEVVSDVISGRIEMGVEMNRVSMLLTASLPFPPTSSDRTL